MKCLENNPFYEMFSMMFFRKSLSDCINDNYDGDLELFKKQADDYILNGCGVAG